MSIDVCFVKPLPDYQIYVELNNGISGVFDMKPYLNKSAARNLNDLNYFKTVYILFGAVTWQNGEDIEPQTLLNGLKVDNRELHTLKTENYDRGEKDGEIKKAIEIAKKMKAKNTPIEHIIEFTGLSAKEIKQL